jgi:hypothetical protein
LQTASSPEVVQASATDVDGSELVHFARKEARGEKIRVSDDAKERLKKLKIVTDAMAPQFRELLAERGKTW